MALKKREFTPESGSVDTYMDVGNSTLPDQGRHEGPTLTDLYNYWTKHASNDPSAEMQGAVVTCSADMTLICSKFRL